MSILMKGKPAFPFKTLVALGANVDTKKKKTGMYRLICDLPCLPYLDIWDKSNLEQAFIYVLFLDWK